MAFIRDTKAAQVARDDEITIRARVVLASAQVPQEELAEVGQGEKCRTRTVYELQVVAVNLAPKKKDRLALVMQVWAHNA